MVKPTRAIASRRLNVTPALLADIRRRYEHTPDTLPSMAADLGCTVTTVCNIAKRENWVRYQPPPRDLSPAMRLRARAEALAAFSLPRAAVGRVVRRSLRSKRRRTGWGC